MTWNPSRYLKFQTERLRPALDLLRPAAAMFMSKDCVKTVLDLGCGPGNISPFLSETFPNALIEGIDSSNEMIMKALKSQKSWPDQVKSKTSFRLGSVQKEIETPQRKYELVYSNGVLHWCSNHEVLLPSILKSLVVDNGGVLAIQMPDTILQESHVLMETAAWRSGLLEDIKSLRIPRTEHSSQWYYELLSPFCKEIDIWSTEYNLQLSAVPRGLKSGSSTWMHPVLEYLRSTGSLGYIIESLGGENSEKGRRYLLEYDRLLEEAYPITVTKSRFHATGKSIALITFKRFFLVCKT